MLISAIHVIDFFTECMCLADVYKSVPGVWAEAHGGLLHGGDVLEPPGAAAITPPRTASQLEALPPPRVPEELPA